MRRIDFDTLAEKLPRDWLDRAEAAMTKLRQAKPGERSEIIKANERIWKEAKGPLKELSFDKCWYCESENTREDGAVDHFRPKNAVEGSNHEGYWWLAFQWKNFRYACTFCNSLRTGSDGSTGGKGAHFPLFHEGDRAIDDNGLEDELPLLLDPTAAADFADLWFDESGEVRPRHENDAFLRERARTSIRRYHLYEQRLVIARRRYCQAVRALVGKADAVLATMQKGSPKHVRYRDERVTEIRLMLLPSSQYTAAAFCTLVMLSKTSSVAEIVIRAR